jgi:hypothetical protein
MTHIYNPQTTKTFEVGDIVGYNDLPFEMCKVDSLQHGIDIKTRGFDPDFYNVNSNDIAKVTFTFRKDDDGRYHLKVFMGDNVLLSESSLMFGYLSCIMWDHYWIDIDDLFVD